MSDRFHPGQRVRLTIQGSFDRPRWHGRRGTVVSLAGEFLRVKVDGLKSVQTCERTHWEPDGPKSVAQDRSGATILDGSG